MIFSRDGFSYGIDREVKESSLSTVVIWMRFKILLLFVSQNQTNQNDPASKR